MALAAFLVLSVTSYFILKDFQSSPARNPANLICRSLHEACRGDTDCCSFNCESNVCRPKTAINGHNGEPCRFDGHCLSGNCDQTNHCAPTEFLKSEIGQYSRFDHFCKSGFHDRRFNFCRGSKWQKAYVGQFCETRFECLSILCHPQYKRCLGGPKDLARYNELCTFNPQCASNYCDTRILRWPLVFLGQNRFAFGLKILDRLNNSGSHRLFSSTHPDSRVIFFLIAHFTVDF